MTNETATILFVEDEVRIGALYTRYFETRGYCVKNAADGFMAGGIVNDGGIDLVVMDLSMPNVDGNTGIEVIQEIDDTIPIIVVSACVTPSQIQNGIEGAVKVLSKPADLQELEEAIKKALEEKK